MNPRELLARLNVPAVRYEIGRGGIPELTNIDVAAALGMVEDEFSREVFCALWWPDGAAVARDVVNKQIFDKTVFEYAKRERELVAVRLELHMAESEAAHRRILSEFDKQVLANCKRNIEIKNARRWPWNANVYVRIAGAVIDEKRFPSRCPDCLGRAEAVINNKVVKCERCKGTGIKNRPNIWRATQLGISDTAYARIWCRVYEWVVRMIDDAEARAAAAISAAVARDSTISE